MKKTMLKICLCVGLAFVLSGCVSSMVYTGSKDQIAERRIMASNNREAMGLTKMGLPARRAIKAVRFDNGVALGLDITALETLKERPLLQLGAAVLDAAGTWGIIAIGEHNNWGQGSSSSSKKSSSDHQSSQSSGDNRSAQLTINGDYNNVTISQSSHNGN